ncbi:MAG: phosphoribosylamine--glycine ligase [Candidatus Pelethousia sp.]|nr:phosphoribosylamine--glycine ligase [Candidatus Pelethousia sp.]
MMNVMIIGGGGREHAIVEKLCKNPRIDSLYALPGNGGMGEHAQCVGIRATDLDAIVAFAKANAIDFAVIGPDDPLILGLADRLAAAGVRCFGPSADAAAIEGSKIFAKRLMQTYHIPTASFASFSKACEAYAYLSGIPYPAVIKADGPALGKGVFIAETEEEARRAVRLLMEEKAFGQSGSRVVVEEYLQGREVSVLAFTDGKTLVPMVSALDHKRAEEQDRGPNTGGMGALAPNPYYDAETARICMEQIFLPTMAAMNAEGRKFKGCLYFGLMLTAQGPKVIEYNCRFGDPEAQPVLSLLQTDLFEIMLAVEEERLGEMEIKFQEGAACCVVMASKGYPTHYDTGYEIALSDANSLANIKVYQAGTRREGDKLLTSGGRVLGVTAVATTQKGAVHAAYGAVEKIRFANAYYRRDIGARALEIAPYGEA